MGQQLSEITIQKLLQEIETGRFCDCNMLPPEEELAEIMGVSRSVIRVCLAKMENDGWVTRKHGIGTIINKYVVDIKSRLDISLRLNKAIEYSGKHASLEVLEVRWSTPDETVRSALKIPEDEPVLKTRIRFLADGKPAIYCEDFIPKHIVNVDNIEKNDLFPSIYEFMEKFCNDARIETYVTEVRAIPLTREATEALEVPDGCTMLHLAETGYNLKSIPCIYSREFFWDKVVDHFVIRKMI